jgi:hypothetical protein
MAGDGDDRLTSITLFAAQADFTEAGELMFLINESQIAFLEDMMWEQGFLDSRQMAGAFQMLHSNDLVWSRAVREYLMGERQKVNDLMAWNADATRMPYHMHSEYLRRLFLDNDLAEGRFVAGSKPVALRDIRVPVFAAGTLRDHVAPWRSTYKILLRTETEVTYLLTSGGHNAGIVSEPGHHGRSFQVMTNPADDQYLDPEPYLTVAAGWLLVARMGGLARCAFRRVSGAAPHRRAAVGVCAALRCSGRVRAAGLRCCLRPRLLAPLCLRFLLSVDAVPVLLVGIGDRLLAFTPAVVRRRAPLRLRGPFARGARGLGSGLAFGRAVLACHRLS